MIRKTMLASAFVLTLSLAAFGGRFTDSYDSLESVVQGLQDDLPATLDKSQKKAAKTYKSTLKKLGKDTDSLKKEIKLGKIISNKLQKLGDGAAEVRVRRDALHLDECLEALGLSPHLD